MRAPDCFEAGLERFTVKDSWYHAAWLGEPSTYSVEYILHMIRATGAIVKNNHSLFLFHTSSFCRDNKSLLDGLHVWHLEHNKEWFSIYVMFLDTKIQETRRVSSANMSFFSELTHPHDHETVEKSEKWETKAEIRERLLLLKIETQFSPLWTSSCIQGVLGEKPCNTLRVRTDYRIGKIETRLQGSKSSIMTTWKKVFHRRKGRGLKDRSGLVK